MKDVITPVPTDTYAAADYNELQDRCRGIRPGSGGGNAFTGAEAKGEDAVVYCEGNADLAHHAAPVLIDDNHDWLDRWIRFRGVLLITGAVQVPGGGFDYLEQGAYVQLEGCGYTGTGGLDATGAAPSAANPPDEGTVAGPATSYRVPLEATNLYLYADTATGALYLYNADGYSRRVFLEVTGTSDLGGH